MKFDNYEPVQMFCQNCGHKCLGYRSRDQTVRVECGRCGVKWVSKLKDKRTVDTRMTAPPGQTLLDDD
ncbi:MAG: hypothetical protein FWD58_10800 [Firmicutes bacterium]|nr:hypothetical protein [Bacillota bacterium]